MAHSKEHLGLLRVRPDGVLSLEKMYFADEIRSSEGIAPAEAMDDVAEDELEMAIKLIGSYAGDFDAEKYEDRYRERLMAIIEAKREGESITPAAAPDEKGAPDLIAALRASLEAVEGEAA